MSKPALLMRAAVPASAAAAAAAAAAMAMAMATATAATTNAYADSPLFTSRATLGSLTGQQIYEHICQGCHMPGGQGAVGAGFYPKLSADKNFVSWQFVALTVLNGRNGMPPFGYPGGQATRAGAPHLSDAQIADVVNYVRGHFGNTYKPEVTAKEISLLPHPAAELMGPQ